MSAPTSSMSAVRKAVMGEDERVQRGELLSSVDDLYGGVRVNMEHHPMDSKAFTTLLKASISHWKLQEKRGVWIKLPIEQVNLVEAAVKEGFRYHHAEPDYLMLVYWIPETTDTLPANASRRVGIGAFVMNSKREVLVVMEKGGRFKGTGVWKFPTGVVNEGEDICTAAVREVKEETGIDAEFVEVLAFRESHNSFFSKSDLFFVCMMQPRSFDIQKQDHEVEAAQEGFRYHHAEPDYLMLVYWIPETTDTLPANASHRVCIGAFVMNSHREVLVVMEKGGRFKGTGVWKFPTGVVNEGEDICTAAVREVKEETGGKPQVILEQIRFVLCLHVATTLL
ncbi:hypothetical protein FH972_014221 [Carpinus fangiana]|uniref:Nudix hydrolase domain-containing protein n=1 Tax=Carpinus fangiana TaxID=176857 RepID=A0A5N6R9A2_9ROSI|nr:hypothetical protein FH972_014221 [Carpinus fangiana]